MTSMNSDICDRTEYGPDETGSSSWDHSHVSASSACY